MGDPMDFTMPLVEAMETQRAIRRLKPDPVDEAIILRLIELALKAPTGSNGQNWEFIVVRDPRSSRGWPGSTGSFGASMGASGAGSHGMIPSEAGCWRRYSGRRSTLRKCR